MGFLKLNTILTTDDLCILITTNYAFNSDKNNINQTSENIQPTFFKLGSTWEGIKNQNPIMSNISLENWLNLDVGNKENITIVY